MNSSKQESKKIFLVEDEREIADFVVRYLLREGFQVEHFLRGDVALQAILSTPPDLIILDINLPGVDGLEILRQVRSRGYVPVILLTSRTDEADRVVGLELGADDYVTKPFSPRELTARVKALFRRIRAVRESPVSRKRITAGSVILEVETQRIFYRDGHAALTPIEFSLARALMSRPGKIFSRNELLDGIWGEEFVGETRTVDVHVKNLRRKIRAAGHPGELIRTVRGVGYVFED